MAGVLRLLGELGLSGRGQRGDEHGSSASAADADARKVSGRQRAPPPGRFGSLSRRGAGRDHWLAQRVDAMRSAQGPPVRLIPRR